MKTGRLKHPFEVDGITYPPGTELVLFQGLVEYLHAKYGVNEPTRVRATLPGRSVPTIHNVSDIIIDE